MTCPAKRRRPGALPPRLLLLLSLCCCVAVLSLAVLAAPPLRAAAAAQARPYTPRPGSAERAAIMDALRVPVEKELRKKTVFEIADLRVQNGWAFMTGVPRQPGNRPMDYRGTRYDERRDAFDDGISALLRKTPNGRWRVVTYSIGNTDVPWTDWHREYGAPPSVLGLRVYEPARGERKAILDALRAPVQRELRNRPVVFNVTHFQTRDGWAFLTARPQQPNGKPMNYRGTKWQAAINNGVFSNSVSALLRKQPNGRWRVVTYNIGATDVVYADWPRRYRAPRDIFP